MKKNILILSALAFSMFSCVSNDSPKEETTKSEEIVEIEENTEGNFGAKISEKGTLTMDEFASQMEGKDSLEVKFSSVVEDVCSKKGCWMKVQTASGDLMRVSFKDYGFFVPMDIHGKQVIMEGVAFTDTTSIDDLKHFAEDAGQSQEEIDAITEEEISLSFIADGVIVKD